MKRTAHLIHEFVDFIPSQLKDGTVYVSLPFATAVHKCCCGCGNEVVTPLSPTDWTLIFDGASISLDPSIGNWSFSCRSHYWITRNTVMWARDWSSAEVEAVRGYDKFVKQRHLDQIRALPPIDKRRIHGEGLRDETPLERLLRKAKSWWA